MRKFVTICILFTNLFVRVFFIINLGVPSRSRSIYIYVSIELSTLLECKRNYFKSCSSTIRLISPFFNFTQMIKKQRPSTSGGVIRKPSGTALLLESEAPALPPLKYVRPPGALELVPSKVSFSLMDPTPLIIPSPLLVSLYPLMAIRISRRFV